MTTAARFGVRSRETSELRPLVWIAGSLWLVFSLTNGLLEATIRDLISHPNAHLALGWLAM